MVPAVNLMVMVSIRTLDPTAEVGWEEVVGLEFRETVKSLGGNISIGRPHIDFFV